MKIILFHTVLLILCINNINCELWGSKTIRNKEAGTPKNFIFDDYIKKAKSFFFNKQDPIATNRVEYFTNSDADLTTPQLLEKYGYPAESHAVVTEDGYVLTLHRIPKPKGQPVLLHHGLLGSSADWIIPGPGRGLAYILSDAGYDVWLGNARGNTYSRIHPTKSDSVFWNFSFHEIGYYDLPAYIDYINLKKNTSGEILYVGHSMGTTILFVLLSTRPEYNHKLKAGFTLAPVAYLTSVRSPIRILAPFTDNVEIIAELLGVNEFLPQNIILKLLARELCEINKYEEEICENVIFILCGFDEKQFNKTLLPVILGHTPAGASTKTIFHFGQEIKDDGAFQMFDYGTARNIFKYGQKKPPQYPIQNITLPIAYFVSDNDWLASIKDAEMSYNKLINPIEFYLIPFKGFNHLDFIWGTDAKTLVYDKLISIMKNYTTTQFDYLKNVV